MKLIEQIESNQKVILTTIMLVITLLFLFDTGPGEIQPWDESMYIIRAKSIINYGDWLDQTSHAAGGLYSASHPPLFIWLTAVSISLFGENNFSLRLFSVIFSIGIVWILFYFFEDKIKGFIAAILTACVPIFYFYSHQAQLDIAVTFFVLLSIFLYSRYEGNKKKYFLFFTGVAFGLAVMSKIAIGFIIPLSLLVYNVILCIQKRKNLKEIFFELSVVFILGLIIFLPWHLYMIFQNEDFLKYFLDYHILKRVTEGVESNEKSLGLFFYINQAMIAFSATLPFIYFTFKNTIRDKTILLCVSVALICFIIISASATQLQSYLIVIIPFIAILIAEGLYIGLKQEKYLWGIIFISVILAVWSFSRDARNDVKLLLTNFEITNTLLISVSIGILLLLLFLFLSRKYQLKPVIISATLFMLILAVKNPRQPYYESKIVNASTKFFNCNLKNLVYIDYKYGSIVHNPQISYYFKCLDLGWIKNKNFTFINADSLNHEIKIPGNSLVIVASETVNSVHQVCKVNKAHKDSRENSIHSILNMKDMFMKDKIYYYYLYDKEIKEEAK